MPQSAHPLIETRRQQIFPVLEPEEIERLERFGERKLQISEFPTGDFGSNRQAVSVETDRPFRSKAAPRCGWVLVPTLANRRCVIHPILLWSAKASTLVIIIISSDCCGRLWIVLI